MTNAEIAEILKIGLKQKIRQKNNFNDNPTISAELGKKIAELEILINNITIEKTPLEEYIAKSQKNR